MKAIAGFFLAMIVVLVICIGMVQVLQAEPYDDLPCSTYCPSIPSCSPNRACSHDWGCGLYATNCAQWCNLSPC